MTSHVTEASPGYSFGEASRQSTPSMLRIPLIACSDSRTNHLRVDDSPRRLNTGSLKEIFDLAHSAIRSRALVAASGT